MIVIDGTIMKTESSIRIGVIGAGWWATFAHIPAVRSHPDGKLVAVHSRNGDDARRIARDFGIPHAFTSVDELLALESVDAVIIASTPNMHYEHALAALHAGKHVLLEKPMTFTAAESARLCELAATMGLELIVSCPWHYTAHAIAARKLILDGAIGRVKMISVLMTNPIDKLLKGINTSPTFGMSDVYCEPCLGSYNDPAIAGGGQIYCQVSHAAAYWSFLTGKRPAEVFARFDNDGSVNDIYDTLNVKMEDGCLVSLATTGATAEAGKAYEVRVFGSKGTLHLELWQGTMSIHWFDGKSEEFPQIAAEETYPAAAPAKNLIDVLAGHAPNLSPGIFGHAAMEVIEAACQSAACGRNIVIR